MSAENPFKSRPQDSDTVEDHNKAVKKVEEDIARRIAETGTWRSKHGEEVHQLAMKQLKELETYPQGQEAYEMYERHLNERLDLHGRQQREKKEGASD